jgi:hypothetical protein
MSTDFQTRLFEAVNERRRSQRPPAETAVEVQGAIRHLTALYERIRTLVDYQEERFLRRLAIRRILIRRMLLFSERTSIGEPLVAELVRAAYLENGTVAIATAKQIDERLAKYVIALPVISKRYQTRELLRRQRRLLGIAAAEIEDLLHPAAVEALLDERLADEIASYLGTPVTTDVRIVAIRSLAGADAELVAWRLTRSTQPEWWTAFVANPSGSVGELLRELVRIESAIRQPTLEARVRQFARLIPPYLVLADLAYRHTEVLAELADDPTKLRVLIETTVRQRLAHTEARIQRSMVRATVYIILSKVILGLPIEASYDLAAHGRVAILPLVINTLIPPSLMLTAALSLHPPSSANSVFLTGRTLALIGGTLPPALEGIVRHPRIRGRTAVLFGLLYLVTYLVVFSGVVWLLRLLAFTWVSALVFFVFVSIVGFFAFRLRAAARELSIIEEREGAFLAVFDFVAVPFLRVGRFLSLTVRSLNIVLFFMDFIIEAPLKLVFVVLEDWFAFLREKREELR